MTYRHRGKTCAGSEFADPLHLSNGIATLPLGFDKYGRLDLKPCCIAQVVRRQVIAPDCRVVSIAKGDLRLIAKPGQIVRFQIPEMLMRIDDGDIEQSALLLLIRAC